MGAWGVALYSDDMASDVRDDFKDYIGDGLSSEDATRKMVSEYQPERDMYDVWPVFWLALADTQWSLGRLLPEVKERALHVLESGSDLERWNDDPKSDMLVN